MPIPKLTKAISRNLTTVKKALSLVLILAVLTGMVAPGEPLLAAPAYRALPISAPSALLLDAGTHRVIYAKSPHLPRPPASTTKVMTALVVLDRLPLNRVVRIPSWVKSIEPSKAYLRTGEHYRVRELLHATLISSANDAAEVLAVAAAGSRARFAQWMNDKARRIGCRNTHFVRASGLPAANQYSTTYDLALIMKEAQRNAFIVDSLGRRYHSIRSREGRTIWLRNHNRLLWKTSRTVIGKTGYTRKGRYCFVGRIKWMGREVLVSLLGSQRLWTDLKVLLDYQFGMAVYKANKNRARWSPAQVREIQAALKRAGYSPGKTDGKLGPKTIRAIEQFQKKRGLKPDGIVGPATCKKLTPYGLSRGFCS
jgi:D-alanyl-D-alanine carboxypeptidase (penicillin-binding protein 5/6)